MGTRGLTASIFCALALLFGSSIAIAQTWQTWPYFPPPQGGPLQAANVMAAVVSTTVASFSNITLSGIQTIDGVSVGGGQTVLVAGQTTASQDGIYISASGAWTRAPNFPAGYVIAQNCDLNVMVATGTLFKGTLFHLTTSSPITIGTTAQSWTIELRSATTGTLGMVTVTANGQPVTSQVGGLLGITNGDCVSFTDANGSVGDNGNGVTQSGPCAVTDVNGHPIFQGNGTAPTVTGAGCSLASGSFDTTGAITATGVDTCTLTFGGVYTTVPFCVATGESATVLPFINTRPTVSAVVFKTAAAGSFEYHCL